MAIRWKGSRIFPAALVLALTVGCGQPEEAADDGAEPEGASLAFDSETAPPARPVPDAPEAVRAELEARGGTDIVGFALLTPRGDKTAVTVEIHAANSGWPYVAELIGGSCANSGPVIAALGEITAGEGGDAEYHRVMDRSLLPPDGADRAVWIRGADDPTAVVACGDLGAPTESTSATDR